MKERVRKTTKDEQQADDAELETTDIDTSDVDDLLDEIDEVLEENAEEFVKNYVQKGGE